MYIYERKYVISLYNDFKTAYILDIFQFNNPQLLQRLIKIFNKKNIIHYSSLSIIYGT